MSTRIAVVTGANKGIGYEVVQKLCQAGYKTVVACRNRELGTRAVESLTAAGHSVEFRQLDISDIESISTFKSGMESTYGHIDILINNAAIAFKAADPTPSDKQARPTVTVNYFGTVHVTEALLPLLKASAISPEFRPRVVNVASLAGHLSILRSEEIKKEFTDRSLTVTQLSALMNRFIQDAEAKKVDEIGWPKSNYGTSKLGVIAYTKVLARDHPDLLVNCCCPGRCQTDMSSNRGTHTAEVGARTVVLPALLPDNATTTGCFYEDEKESVW